MRDGLVIATGVGVGRTCSFVVAANACPDFPQCGILEGLSGSSLVNDRHSWWIVSDFKAYPIRIFHKKGSGAAEVLYVRNFESAGLH